ncbi:MAG: Fic family protein [Clostridia bacterium]|nr:Fic family protein [Clostridia bacterium]
MPMEETPQAVPRLEITEEIVFLIADIAQKVGELTGEKYLEYNPTPQEDHAEKAVLGSLNLEDSHLTLEQTLKLAREMDAEALSRQEKEAKNALNAYAELDTFDPTDVDALLKMHRILMDGLMAEPGIFRAGNVGVYQGNTLIHQGAPAREIRQRVAALCDWLRTTKAHPLVRACIFHYALELIHPFSDGNGPLGRLCQTAILTKWHPIFRFTPVEVVLSRQRMGYFNAFIRAENAEECGPFVLFMLGVIWEALAETVIAGKDEITGNEPDASTGTPEKAQDIQENPAAPAPQAEKTKNDEDETHKAAEKKLLSLLRSAPNSTQEDLAAAIKRSTRTVRAMMRALQERGVIQREGARKNGLWIIKE